MKERLQRLPKILVAEDGTTITTAELWEKKRRPELINMFREWIYGREPERPTRMSFKYDLLEDALTEKADQKSVTITIQGRNGIAEIHFNVFFPKQMKSPVPAFLLLDNREMAIEQIKKGEFTPFFPVEHLIENGYAAANVHISEFDPDYDDGFKNGFHGIMDSSSCPRSKNAWATISAWAWGASLIMDYFEVDQDVDEERIALVGHSRGGKAALWAGALDQRFAMIVSNNSGNTGAAISRGKKGETIRDINTVFPHWFTENYKLFNDREYELPIDQHQLLALIAPRLLYVSSASNDDWADPESEFLSVSLLEDVYQLYGLHSIGPSPFPKNDISVMKGNVGYHVRTGEHNLVEFDWNCFIDFANKKLK